MIAPQPTIRHAVFKDEFFYEPLQTNLKRYPVWFVMDEGGMGDFIQYSAATLYAAKHMPWMLPTIAVPEYLVPLYQDIHKEFDHVTVVAAKQGMQIPDGVSRRYPRPIIFGARLPRPLITHTTGHQMDTGFGYFCDINPAPKGAQLPVLDYPESRLLPKIKKLKGNYAVLATGYTWASRRSEGKHINPIIDHLLSKNITPVFLGKSTVTHNHSSEFADDVDYDKGIDLRNQTSVKDAALIMQHALLTAGIDGGLLHLAALMKDSRVVFGYTITDKKDREPRRSHGKTVHVYLTPEELPCTACQSRFKLMYEHDYSKCVYVGDDKRKYGCITKLFENESERWKKAIDEVLS